MFMICFLSVTSFWPGWQNSEAEQQEPPVSSPVTIAIIQPRGVDAYREAVEGFLYSLRNRIHQRFNTVIYESPEGLYKTLKQNEPSHKSSTIQLIVTIGTQATNEVSRTIHDIPIVFSMVLNPERVLSNRTDIVGASLNIPFSLQLEMINKVLPTVKTVGIIYDPTKHDNVLMAQSPSKKQYGLRLTTFPVTSPKEIPGALSRVNKETDVLLGIVDSTVYTSRTTASIIRYTIKHQLPFVGISASYVKAGALCALLFNSRDIGRQTAQLAEQVLSGIPPTTLQNTIPEKIYLALNLRTARLIDVTIPKKIQEKAEILYE